MQVFEQDLGCTGERADPGWPDPYETFWGLVINESDLAGLRKLAGSLGDRMSAHLADALRADWTAEQLTSAVMGRKAFCNAAWRFFRRYNLLPTPTLAVPDFEHGIQGPTDIGRRTVELFYWLSFTLPFNLTGQPAATVPAGRAADRWAPPRRPHGATRGRCPRGRRTMARPVATILAEMGL